MGTTAQEETRPARTTAGRRPVVVETTLPPRATNARTTAGRRDDRDTTAGRAERDTTAGRAERDTTAGSRGRGQLRARRALAVNAVNVEVTWSSDIPTGAADQVKLGLGDAYIVEALELSVQSISVSIEGAEPIALIDVKLPIQYDDNLPPTQQGVVEDMGSTTVAFGGAAMMCVIAWVL